MALAARAEKSRTYVLPGNKVVMGREGLEGELGSHPKTVKPAVKKSFIAGAMKFIGKLKYR